jgi:hypothetical protein
MIRIGVDPSLAGSRPLQSIPRKELLERKSRGVTAEASTGGHVGEVVDVPEPGRLALFGLGLAGLGFVRRRKVAA